MEIDKLNSYLIIYIFLDFLKFLKENEIKMNQGVDRIIINNDINKIETYIILYLKQCIGSKELNLFLKEIQNIYNIKNKHDK